MRPPPQLSIVSCKIILLYGKGPTEKYTMEQEWAVLGGHTLVGGHIEFGSISSIC